MVVGIAMFAAVAFAASGQAPAPSAAAEGPPNPRPIVAADTRLGPFYFAYGRASGGQSSFYIYLGRP